MTGSHLMPAGAAKPPCGMSVGTGAQRQSFPALPRRSALLGPSPGGLTANHSSAFTLRHVTCLLRMTYR